MNEQNRAQRRRNLSDARRRVGGGTPRGEQLMARPVPIGLGVVKMGHWYRVRGAPQAFQVIAVEWSQSEPPVPDQVLLKPEGGSDEDVMAGPARALLRADCEYVGPPDWGTKKHAVDCDMDEDCRCGVE